MIRFFLRGWPALLAVAACAAGPGESVAVIYNKNLPESKKVAQHYAEKRGVPSAQLFGVDVSANDESIARADFNARLHKPVHDWLVGEKLFTLNKAAAAPGAKVPYLSDSKIRYLVLCYGLPLKVTRDGGLKEAGSENLQEPLRGRNEAAVDAELALLPNNPGTLPLNGPMQNPLYLATNAAFFHPTNGLLLVTRLDGPTADIANHLVDKAMQAEAEGLWGRAYFDARGITNGSYKIGDDWMRTSAEISRRLGFEVVLDNAEPTFNAGFPLSHVAFYAGWYDGNVSGPFTRPTVEFMPGAFAYHLHSISAASLRTATQFWVGPLLAKGATITMGCVDEPYLTGTPNLVAFVDRLIFRRFDFAEAAYASQGSLSWQTTVVGDPLYRPFGLAPEQRHEKLEREKSPLLPWSHLKIVCLNEATGLPPAQNLKYLDELSLTKKSAVLLEKAGDLERMQKRIPQAIERYAAALKQKPSPQQKLRLLMIVGDLQAAAGKPQAAVDAYKEIVADIPDYPNAAAVYQRLADLSRQLGRAKEAEKYARLAQDTKK